MSNANTIPEFLGIIVATIIIASVVGVGISMAYEEASKTIKSKLNTNARSIPSSKTGQQPNNEMFKEQKKIIKPRVIIEEDTSEEDSTYTSGMKETLRPLYVEKMFNLAVEECHNIINKGHRVGDTELAFIVKTRSNMFKEHLIENKDQIAMTKKEINDFIDEVSIAVSNKFIDMNLNKKL